MGTAALEGRPGVLQVEKGWQGYNEVNRVAFDPQQVTIEKMVGWLKETKTYRATLESSFPNKGVEP